MVISTYQIKGLKGGGGWADRQSFRLDECTFFLISLSLALSISLSLDLGGGGRVPECKIHV